MNDAEQSSCLYQSFNRDALASDIAIYRSLLRQQLGCKVSFRAGTCLSRMRQAQFEDFLLSEPSTLGNSRIMDCILLYRKEMAQMSNDGSGNEVQLLLYLSMALQHTVKLPFQACPALNLYCRSFRYSITSIVSPFCGCPYGFNLKTIAPNAP